MSVTPFTTEAGSSRDNALDTYHTAARIAETPRHHIWPLGGNVATKQLIEVDTSTVEASESERTEENI